MFRNMLSDMLGLAGSPIPYSYAWQELAIAIVGAVLFAALIPVFTRIFFAINRNGSPAKIGGIITGLTLALVWAGMTMDLLGFFSTIIFLVLGVIVLIAIVVYELVAK
jgi:uncharacterized membrane protein